MWYNELLAAVQTAPALPGRCNNLVAVRVLARCNRAVQAEDRAATKDSSIQTQAG
jgi:hypothetical protein